MLRDDQLEPLVNRLLEGTRKGLLSWHQDRQQARTLVLRLDHGTVRLGHHPSADAYDLSVRNEEGSIVAETGAFLPRQVKPRLGELYDLANSQVARGAGLDDLRKEVIQSGG